MYPPKPPRSAMVRRAAQTVNSPDRAAFYRRVDAVLRGLQLVGDGALNWILVAARCGQPTPQFDARSFLDRIEDE